MVVVKKRKMSITEKQINNIKNKEEKKHTDFLNDIFKKQLKLYCKTYYSYDDGLNGETIIKYITEEDLSCFDGVYNNVSNFEEITALIDGLSVALSDEDNDYLRDLCSDNWDFNIDDLIKNRDYYFRIDLLSSEDSLTMNDLKNSDTFKGFVKQFGHKKELLDLAKETPNDYGVLSIPLKVKGYDLEKFKKAWEKGKITIKKGVEILFFNSWLGGGSLGEVKLKHNITLKVKEWVKGDKYANLKLNDESQSINKRGFYNIRSVYGSTNGFYNEWL